MAVAWSLRHTLEVGDRAIGVPVLTELYDRMKAKPVDVNLTELWRRLGIEVRGDTVVFQEDAPLATIRRAITTAAQGH